MMHMATCHPDKPYLAHGLCRNCYERDRRAKGLTWDQKYPEKSLAIRQAGHRKHAYGLSREEFAALLERQGGACPLCGRTDQKLVVDHDHATGKVRGLLCTYCNVGLRWIERGDDWLAKAQQWLRRSA